MNQELQRRNASIDGIRAIAVIMVVVTHCIGGKNAENIFEMTILRLISGGSSIFLFVSGFLFQKGSESEFNFLTFLTKRAKTILIPYAVLTGVFLSLYFIFEKLPPYVRHFTEEKANYSLFEWIELYFNYLWTGRIAIPYWFIPTIFIFFLLSPLFIRFSRIDLKWQISILVILFIVSGFSQKSFDNISPIHSSITFSVFYLMGILAAKYEMKILNMPKKALIYFGISATLLSFIQVNLFQTHLNLHKESFLTLNGFDLFYLKEGFIIIFLWVLFTKWVTKVSAPLKFISERSLPIFFLHQWVIMILEKAVGYESLAISNNTFILIVFTFAYSFLFVEIAKAYFPSRSKLLFGY
ncbi:MAG: acyltransferase [Chloroherpetonaceae bacterium]|nr:acyltransferase [Chloroherpetonaceae bacterium]